MAALTPSATYTGAYAHRTPQGTAIDGGIPRYKVGYVYTDATADATNTVVVDVYSQWGMTKVLAFDGYVHTTTGSVITTEVYIANTFTGTTLTMTVPAGTNDDVRFIAVYGI
jgi:hypothetical protein